ncbi:MAG: hypothetical protein WBZ37_31595 [Mycobacterium sp.]
MQYDGPSQQLLQPLRHLLLALIFESDIALHGLHSEHEPGGPTPNSCRTGDSAWQNHAPGGKGYLFFPALSGRRRRSFHSESAIANRLRNLMRLRSELLRPLRRRA